MAAAIPYVPYVLTAVSAVGAIKQGQAQQAAAQYQADTAAENARITEAQGNQAAAQHQIETQRKIGAAMAAYGASGVDMGIGTPGDYMADMVRTATLDRLTLKYNYRMKALGYERQSALSGMEADNARDSMYLNTASSLMSSYAKMG